MTHVPHICIRITMDEQSVKTKRSQMRRWIHERDLEYNVEGLDWNQDLNAWVQDWYLYDKDAALLFKLTFGGA